MTPDSSAAPFTTAGFFDLQVNGFAGVDFNDPAIGDEELERALAALRPSGVTRCLPTLITAPLDRFAACARRLAACRDPAVVGLHAEGPYLSPDARGAHPLGDLLPASLDDFERRQEAADGRILLVTLAPEVPGALPLIEALVGRGIRVALGHTAAPPGVIRDAVRAGATLSTHLGNGTPAVIPRHPNFLWEQLAADELCASIIADGHHLAPSMLKTIVRAKTPGRIVLATDAVAAAGQPPGPTMLAAVPVEHTQDGRVVLRGGTKLAGSALTMDAAVGNLVRAAGVSLADALAAASTRPAALLGQEPAGTLTVRWDEASCRLTVLTVS